MHQVFHDFHGRTGADAGCGLAHDLYGGIPVVALQARRACFPARRGEGGEGHHAAVFVAHVPLVNIIGQHAVLRGRLDIDLFHAAAIHKVVHIAGAPGRLQRVIDIVDGNAQRLRFTLIDIDLHLRAVVEAVMANAG